MDAYPLVTQKSLLFGFRNKWALEVPYLDRF